MTTHPFPRNCWYVAGASDELAPETLTGHVVCGRPIVMWRTGHGDVVAFDDRCAHKRFPLSKGRLMQDGTLECAYHGLRYDMTGSCVMIPSHPTGPISPAAKVHPFPVIEQDGLVWIWPGDPTKSNQSKPPRTPEVGDGEWETVRLGPMDIPANYMLLIENLLDITHFYPLHDGNIGDIANSRIPVGLEEGEVDGNKYVMTVREVQDYQQPPYLADWFHYETVDRVHTHCMQSPGLTRVVMRVAPPGELGGDKDRGYVLLHTHTPVDERNHIWRILVNCKAEHMSAGDPDMSAAKRVASMFPPVLEEDRWALEEQQKMFDYPDEDYSEVFLKPDKGLRRARQIIYEMARAEEAAGRQAEAAE